VFQAAACFQFRWERVWRRAKLLGGICTGQFFVFAVTTFMLNLTPMLSIDKSPAGDTDGASGQGADGRSAFWMTYLATLLLAGWNLVDFVARISSQVCDSKMRAT
jgi:hypothetical protein